MPGSRQKKKKKTGKKGGGAPKAERPETAERTEAQKEKDEAKNWVELEKQELLVLLLQSLMQFVTH